MKPSRPGDSTDRLMLAVVRIGVLMLTMETLPTYPRNRPPQGGP